MSNINIKNIKGYAVLLTVLILYALEVRFVGLKIPCVFNLITGLKCAGCGTTRMFMALMNFDFNGAFNANPFILCTSPLILYFLGKTAFINCGIIKGRINRVENIILYVYIALLVVYSIVRNIPWEKIII